MTMTQAKESVKQLVYVMCAPTANACQQFWLSLRVYEVRVTNPSSIAQPAATGSAKTAGGILWGGLKAMLRLT